MVCGSCAINIAELGNGHDDHLCMWCINMYKIKNDNICKDCLKFQHCNFVKKEKK